jgi:hypothetical protein
MRNRTTPEETRIWLRDHLRARPDIGVGKAIGRLALGPPAVFDPKRRRALKPGFLFSLLMLGAAIIWFCCFNCLR